MRFILIFFILIFFQSCSFDKKSGIWKYESDASTKQKDTLKGFKSISVETKKFEKIVNFDNNFNIILDKQISNSNWTEKFYKKNNNLVNFKFNNSYQIFLRSKKISNKKISDNLLFHNKNVITSDNKGNILILSIKENKIYSKFNFYKKKYKKIKKNLNLIIENNLIFVSDNIGYLYCFNYTQNKVIWAKNYKIPFRSNLKVYNNKLIAADQNNNLYFFDKRNGEIISKIPTEEKIVKNNFINNISVNDKFTFFLNTSGVLYAIENKSLVVQWFLDLNQKIDSNLSNLFSGGKVISFKDKIIVHSNNFTHVLNSNNGSMYFKKNFIPKVAPIANNNFLFLISEKNFLIVTNLLSGEILFSYNINDKISNFLKSKKKVFEPKNLFLVNGKILVFLKSSHILSFDLKGNLEDVRKIPIKINSNPIFVNDSILFLDNKNKITVIN